MRSIKANKLASTFREKPKTRTGWWAFGLSLGAIVTGPFGPILNIFAKAVNPFISNTLGTGIAGVAGLLLVIAVVAITLVALVLSIKAYCIRERSWAVIIALILSGVSFCLFLFLIIGELLYSH